MKNKIISILIIVFIIGVTVAFTKSIPKSADENITVSHENFINIMKKDIDINDNMQISNENKEIVKKNNISNTDLKIQMFMGSNDINAATEELIENIALSKEADKRKLEISEEKLNTLKKQIDEISFSEKELENLNMSEKEIKQMFLENSIRIEKKSMIKDQIFEEIFDNRLSINEPNIINKTEVLQRMKSEISNNDEVDINALEEVTNYFEEIKMEYCKYIIQSNIEI